MFTTNLFSNSITSLSFNELLQWYKEQSTDNIILIADSICRKIYGDKVFVRGLIEFSNYCYSDCLYCGIRRSNNKVNRYTLSIDEIESVVQRGVKAGIKTFVLQSGEYSAEHPDMIEELLYRLRKKVGNDIAFTLSCGVYPREVYQRWKKAGADRYLLRFETSDEKLFKQLCPNKSLSKRIRALEDLKSEGYAVGSGFMVGLPNETVEIRLQNVLLCRELKLEMVGIGPFIPHPDTPLADSQIIAIDETIRLTALLRIFLPWANIPATTAAGSLDPRGREKMLSAGANVLMPNITPVYRKRDYLLYPNKICIDEDGWECISCLKLRVNSIGKELSMDRGESVLRENLDYFDEFIDLDLNI